MNDKIDIAGRVGRSVGVRMAGRSTDGGAGEGNAGGQREVQAPCRRWFRRAVGRLGMLESTCGLPAGGPTGHRYGRSVRPPGELVVDGRRRMMTGPLDTGRSGLDGWETI